MQPIVYSGRPLRLPGKCKDWNLQGAELLDRSVKPPRLNSLGSRVLEQARDLLQRTEALKSLRRATPNLTASCRVVQIASLAAGDSWERIESPAEGAPCAYGDWGWRADGG